MYANNSCQSYEMVRPADAFLEQLQENDQHGMSQGAGSVWESNQIFGARIVYDGFPAAPAPRPQSFEDFA